MIQFNAGSLKTTILAMGNLKARERKAAAAAAKAAGKILHDKVKQNVSLSDHSQDELDALDHPYAERHGSIRLHERGSKSIVNPAFRVHTQTGTMLSALQQGPTPGGMGWRVEFNDSIAPHAKYVILGTKVMLPRDVVHGTAASPFVQQQMMKSIVKTLASKLRTQSAIRVGG